MYPTVQTLTIIIEHFDDYINTWRINTNVEYMHLH